MFKTLILLACLCIAPMAQAADNVFSLQVNKKVEAVYEPLKKSLEDARFYVVFEPNIGANIAGFAKRWGEDYNRNGLGEIRSMVFCNGWYANQVSNLDPEMLALCPLHLSLIEKDGVTTILFARPSVIAANSPALKLMQEIEGEVIKAIKAGVK